MIKFYRIAWQEMRKPLHFYNSVNIAFLILTIRMVEDWLKHTKHSISKLMLPH